MSELSDKIEFDKVYEINIGKSFKNDPKSSYHQFKYDFTPASIDKNQESKVTIGSKLDVQIQVPHVDGSAQKYTQFTGNKAPCTNKECVLIYDTRTNEFTLERLQTNFILKKTRLEGTSKAQIIAPRSITPTNDNTNKKKKQDTSIQNDSKKASTTPSNIASNQLNLKQKDSKSAKESSPPKQQTTQPKKDFLEDFNLSDTGTDTDSEL